MQPEEARAQINQWFESVTAGRIKELLPRGSIDSNTLAVLGNAIYFKGAWATPFRRAATKDEPFGVGEAAGPVPTMHLTGSFNYAEDDEAGLQVLSLPYAGHELSMAILLPRKPDGLSGLEA